MDLFFRSCATQGFYAFDVPQAKERSYHDQCPTNQFLPLIIEIFGYTNRLMCFKVIMSMPFGVSKGQKTLLFLSWFRIWGLFMSTTVNQHPSAHHEG